MSKFENHKNYNCKITLDTGEEYKIYANWMHNNDIDHWQGWHCTAGYLQLYIDNNFDVWSGRCHNDHLGNALETWNPKLDTICKQPTCTGCTDDLIAAKYEK